MSRDEIRVQISLLDLAPELATALGDQGYLQWTGQLTSELRTALAAEHGPDLRFTLATAPLRGTEKKGADLVLAIGAVTAVLSLGGAYAVDPQRTATVLRTIWHVLKRLLPSEARVLVTYEKKAAGGTIVEEKVTLQVTARDHDAAARFVDAGGALLESLRSRSLPGEEKPTLKITPQRP